MVLNEQVKFTPHLSVRDFFHKMTEWKVVSAEIPLHFILFLGSQFTPRNVLTSFSSLLRVPFSSGKGAGRKLNGGILPDFAWKSIFLLVTS